MAVCSWSILQHVPKGFHHMNYFMCSLTETEMFAVLGGIFLVGTIAIMFLQSSPWMKMQSFGVVGQSMLIGALALWYIADPCGTVN